MEVQRISQQMIKPSHPTPSHLQTIPISFLDQRLTPITVPFIFYYPINSIQHTKILSRLRNSLSDILTLFYPLAGRYIKESFFIRCNDEGVPYSEALVNTELSDILRGRFQVHELNRLIPDDQHILEESDTSPQIAIQINIFERGGLAIGIVLSHRIMDAFTLSLFTHGWAKACKTGHIGESPVPNFESGVLFPTRDSIGVQKSPSVPDSESQVVTERFVFRRRNKRISTSMVIAIIWRAQIKAARAKHGVARIHLLSILVNLRGITWKRIPDNCCGNFLASTFERFEEEDHEEMGLNVFVEKVRETIKRTISEIGEAKGDDRFYELTVGTSRRFGEEARKGGRDIHWFSTIRDFPFYEVDFGWGKPAWLSLASRKNEAVMLFDSKDGDGVEAWVSMDTEEMEYFRNDPDILSMSSGGSLDESRHVKIRSCI